MLSPYVVLGNLASKGLTGQTLVSHLAGWIQQNTGIPTADALQRATETIRGAMPNMPNDPIRPPIRTDSNPTRINEITGRGGMPTGTEPGRMDNPLLGTITPTYRHSDDAVTPIEMRPQER